MEKKKKKTKYQPLDISMTVVKSSWAEEVEDKDGLPIGDLNALREKLPTAPKASRQMYDISQLPPNGPWKAKLSNLPFNVKEEEIIKFLGGETEVKDIDIPYSGNRMRGYAVADFVSRDALANALAKNDDSIMGRRIPINIYTNEDSHYNDGGRDTWGRRDDRRPPRDDDVGDWRSTAIQSRDETIGRQERSSPANGDWSSARGPRRPWQDDDSRPSRRFDSRPTYDRYESGERDGGPRREWNRDSEYRSDRDRDFDRRRERPSYDRENRDYDTRDRRDGGRSYEKMPEKSVEPITRTRLVLQPRTKPVETPSENGKEASTRSSIFGAAKPVDTASKEREIENRMERDKTTSSEFPRRRFMGSESSLTEKDDSLPSGGSQLPSGGPRSFRSRKSSDSSSHGQVRASSSNNSPGVTGRRGSDSEPTSPAPRVANETSINTFSENTKRQQKVQSSTGNEEDESQSDSRNRRSSTTSGDSSQPTVQVVDAPPPPVNVWQVRRSQMQKRAEAAAASAASTELDSTRISASASANNNNATPPVASRNVPSQSIPSKEEESTVEEDASTNANQTFAEEEKHSGAGDNVSSETPDNDKEDRVAATPSQPPRRPPVVVSVSAAQRAAAEGQPPPPPIHENAWHHSQGGMDSVRRPPSPLRLGSGNPQSSYPSERPYQYQSHHPHGGHNDWQDGGRMRMDYRDNSGGYRGSGYRGGGGNRSWRGRGGRGAYRGRGRGGGGGYRYGNEPGSADM